MTEAEKLALCRVMVEQPADAAGWSDDVLKSYLSIAGQKILNRAYPYDDTVTEVPRRYGVLQCEIATYLLNKRGAEGEISHSENGINRTYENADVPDSMLSGVIPHCGVI
jgi:hypothetical protein